MFEHRYAIFALAFVGLASLACGGVADVPGMSSKADPSKLRVGASDIKKSSTKQKGPSAASVNSEKRRDEYVVKLRAGVTELKLEKNTIKSGDAGLDKEFGQLGLTGATQVLQKAAKDRKLAGYLGLDRTVHFKTKKSEKEVREKLSKHPDVEWVEPVVNVKRASTPNDPYFSYQWHMAMLNVPEAWEITMGEGVVVAVVDTGVSVGEDGFHKVLPGWDFVDNDSDPQDLNMHGTHVAGTIGQATDNGVGVAGVAPKVSILPVRVLDANGSGSNTWVANGIVWAADNGANIINLSLGSQMEAEVVSDAVAYAHEKGVTVVAATGNDGFTDHIGYPAALEQPIAVGSVGANKTVAFYSNQGKQIDIVAPGGDTGADINGDGMGDGVLQHTIAGGVWDYQFLQGTSMATPHVAGVAALLYAHGVTTPDGIREALTSTADDLGASGWDTVYGHGLVNPVAALNGAGKVARKPAQGGGGGGGGGGGLTIVKARGKSLGGGRAMIGWTTNQPSTTLIKGDDGFKDKDETLVQSHRVTVAGTPGQTVTYQIRSMAGNASADDKVTVTF